MGQRRMGRRVAVLGVLCGSVACGGVMRQMGFAPSRAFEPPRTWQSGVKFGFSDPARFAGVRHSTRVEFENGGRRWAVTERDLFITKASEIRTAWYPLRPQEQPVELYFTIEHPGGVRTTAQFPLPVRRGQFYSVFAYVYTKRPIPGEPPSTAAAEAPFPLHPRAAAEPGDSLWIGFYIRSRECFDCPT